MLANDGWNGGGGFPYHLLPSLPDRFSMLVISMSSEKEENEKFQTRKCFPLKDLEKVAKNYIQNNMICNNF